MFAFSRPEPVVTVVTPCRNSGRFLRETIESVLAQDYPHIDYIVVDGASTDNTVEILRSYGDRLRWLSEPDRGQSDAINKGFAMRRGEVFTFLNGDDTFKPGAVAAAVRAFAAHPEAAVVYGDGDHVAEDGSFVSRYPTLPADHDMLSRNCPICQPAAFVRSAVFEEIGGIDNALHFALDYDLWLRIAQRYSLVRVPGVFATSRMYSDNKTLSSRSKSLRESIEVARRTYGQVRFDWAYAYSCYLIDRRDQFFEVSRASPAKFALAVMVGLRYNWRHPLRWLAECAAEAGAYFRRRITSRYTTR